ncbi:MAG TPA: diguanylate cyclase [Rhizomicrobium sp.]|jgi:diguanylate cyclase (GGDEF)-like protein|nr:diguanylate cyclase [Rhizomicrobium sp.]
MHLATITNWAYGATVVLTLASGTTMLLASNAQDNERAAVAQRYKMDQASSKIADEVTALSDQAREYVITGAASYLSLYRRAGAELGSVEDRTRAVKDIGAGADELNALADAMRLADGLQDEQKRAVAARERGDEDQARGILFGAEYERELDRVAANVERFQYRLDQRTNADVRAAISISRIWRYCSEGVLALTGLLFLWVLYFVFMRRVLRPVVRLSDVVNRLAAQDYDVEAPDYDKIDEIGDMAQAIRVFRENGLERQRLEKDRSADLAMRTMLSRMTQRMQTCETTRGLEQVIESFVPEIAPQFAGRLYLFDKSRNALVETCSWLTPVHSRREFPPTACWALQRNAMHRPARNEYDIPCEHLDPSEGLIDSICLPLIAHRTTLGVLYFESREDSLHPSANVSEDYLKMLAENISLALGNLRLRDALRDMAMVDELTGLANRRHLDAVLEMRSEEAKQRGEPISCVMVDIDHFKRFNDEFGHEAGDAVLRATGDLFRQSTRESDTAFRYGGEEFLLLMPGLDAEHAFKRTEEIQTLVRALRVEHGGRELGPITMSFGLASAPAHCAFNRLIQAADAALYHAKEKGRDQIVVSEARLMDQRMAS